MSTYETLRRARALVAQGWRAVQTVDDVGHICCPHAEEATNFCLLDALAVGAGGDVDSLLEAWAMLAVLADARHLTTLFTWEEQPGRTKEEVLALLDRAVMRAAAMERGARA